MAKVYFLGTGTSSGVPQIGCSCAVCSSHDARDTRLRTSVLLETAGRHFLFDCGPDFRYQMLKLGISKIDAIFITHEHYDHIGGLEDLRPSSLFKNLPVYADALCAEHLKQRLGYIFRDGKYPGVPQLDLHVIDAESPSFIKGLCVTPVRVLHGQLPILGYRVEDIAFITDMSQISAKEKEKLKGLKLLIVNALRQTPHHSHQMLSEALELIREVRPEESYLIHMSHQMGLHETVDQSLPPHVHLAYDGLVLEV